MQPPPQVGVVAPPPSSAKPPAASAKAPPPASAKAPAKTPAIQRTDVAVALAASKAVAQAAEHVAKAVANFTNLQRPASSSAAPHGLIPPPVSVPAPLQQVPKKAKSKAKGKAEGQAKKSKAVVTLPHLVEADGTEEAASMAEPPKGPPKARPAEPKTPPKAKPAEPKTDAAPEPPKAGVKRRPDAGTGTTWLGKRPPACPKKLAIFNEKKAAWLAERKGRAKAARN